MMLKPVNHIRNHAFIAFKETTHHCLESQFVFHYLCFFQNRICMNTFYRNDQWVQYKTIYMIFHHIIPQAFQHHHLICTCTERHFKHNLYSGFMACFDHILKSSGPITIRRICTLRSKIEPFSISPVISICLAFLKFIHRHTMDLINSKICKIIYLFYNPLKRSFRLYLRRSMSCKSPYMQTVGNYLMIRDL